MSVIVTCFNNLMCVGWSSELYLLEESSIV